MIRTSFARKQVAAVCELFAKQEAFEKCWAHSPLRAAARRLILHCHSPGVATSCRLPPAHRCPQQRQRMTEGTAMAHRMCPTT